jgi:6-phosphofructokinase 2
MRELEHLAGEEIESEEHQLQVARQLIEQGSAEVVVVSLGAAGALLVSAEGAERVRAPTVRIQSKIGAGDSMVAGLLLALARGKSLSKAVHFGVAAGAATVATPGTELLHREEAESLFQKMLAER